MRTTELKPTRCPWCGYQAEVATNLTRDAAPKPGDVTLCIKCGEWSVFDAGPVLRTPTPAEFNDIVAHPETLRLRAAWLTWKRAAKHG